jgi:hypothetical protein
MNINNNMKMRKRSNSVAKSGISSGEMKKSWRGEIMKLENHQSKAASVSWRYRTA